MKLIIIIFFVIGTINIFAQEFTFTFNPPDTSFKEKMIILKSTLLNGKENKVDEITTESMKSISKRETGYTLKTQPMTMNSKRNGEQFTNPLFVFLTNIPTTAILDKFGKMLTVYGYETIIPKAQKELPAELMDQLVLSANEESMINKAKADWSARVSNFSNQTVQLGDLFTGRGIFPLPNGEKVTFFSAIKIEDTITYNKTKCLKISFKNSSVPEDLSKFVDRNLEELSEIYNISANDNIDTEIKISGEGYRIIDPVTMLLHYEINKRTIFMVDEIIGDESNERTIIESKEYIYNYDKEK